MNPIFRCFRKVLAALSSPPFYTRYVQLPGQDSPIPYEIASNSKLSLFFDRAIGAIDGTHINCVPSLTERVTARNRKGGITHNVLACCSFDLSFQYFLSGWDGSSADASVYNYARLSDFVVPQGRFFLADGGFASCDALLIPYRRVRYHLAEWARADLRPANKEELFNLRHASARNVIERIFGILKRRFVILTHPPEYSMAIQVRLPPALGAMHNFIRLHDPGEIDDFVIDDEISGENQGGAGLGRGPAGIVEQREANRRRNEIAQAMWVQYQEILHERGMDAE